MRVRDQRERETERREREKEVIAKEESYREREIHTWDGVGEEVER